MEIGKDNDRRITLALQQHATQDVPGTEDPWPAILERLNSASVGPESIQSAKSRVARQAEAPYRRLSWKLPITLLRGPATNGGSRFLLSAGILAICVIIVAVMIILPTVNTSTRPSSPAEVLQSAATANSFVPAGKVRHEIFSDTRRSSVSNSITTTVREIWIGNGKNHLLLRENQDQKGDYALVGENTFWSYSPSLVPTLVYTYPYAPGQLKFYVPNSQLISEMQQEIGAYVMSNSTVNDRPALLMERTYSIAPGSPVKPDTGGVLRYRFWIDADTYQVLQDERDIRESSNGLYTGTVDTFMSTMVVDELLDQSRIPSDLFTFVQPPGTLVIPGRGMVWGP